MGSDLGYKHYGNVCGNPNRLGHRSVTYSAQASGLGTGPVCPAPMRSSLVAERWLDVQSGPCNAATTARCCTLCAIRRTLYAVSCTLYADRRYSRRTRLQEEENLEKRDMVNMFSRDLQAKPPQLAALAERCPTSRRAERWRT